MPSSSTLLYKYWFHRDCYERGQCKMTLGRQHLPSSTKCVCQAVCRCASQLSSLSKSTVFQVGPALRRNEFAGISWCRVSTRGECRWPRADAAVHQLNIACAGVIHLHLSRVSQLLLPSWSFPVQKFHFRQIPSDYWENNQYSCEKAGSPANSFNSRGGRWTLDFGWFGNVISKYLSKLRFGTNKIQAEMKHLEIILSSFNESLLRARLWKHELFSVRSIALISTVAKSPDEACNTYKVFRTYSARCDYIVGSVHKALFLCRESVVLKICCTTGKMSDLSSNLSFVFTFTKLSLLNIDSIFKTSQFSKCMFNLVILPRLEPRILIVSTHCSDK